MGTLLADRLRTNFLGALAIAKVEVRAIEKGVRLFKPIVECRCDLIVDDGKTLARTQVKYANCSPRPHAHGAISLSLRKWRTDG
jgi:hypothetical protein